MLFHNFSPKEGWLSACASQRHDLYTKTERGSILRRARKNVPSPLGLMR